MPRYYFHISDGKSLVDDQGLDLIDIEAAKLEALKLAGAVLRDEQPRSLWSGAIWTLEVSQNPEKGIGPALLGLKVSAFHWQ